MYNASGRLSQTVLVDDYLPLVHKQAAKLKNSLPAHIDLDDLIQSGVTGLLEAASRFDPKEGKPFDKFASVRIHGAMIDELRSQDWLPRSVRKSGRDMSSAIRRLEQSMGRNPTEREVANEMGVTLDEYQQLLLDTNHGIIKPIEEVVEETGVDLVDQRTEEVSIVDRLMKGQAKSELVAGMKTLPEREMQILALYYQEEMTMKEIAAVFEVSEVRVCQLHSQALNRLRSKMAP